jgi:Replication-relaxation
MNATTPKIVLQSRDLAVLSSLGEHGLLDTDLIHERYFSMVSRRRCLQRLASYQSLGITKAVHLQVWNGAASKKAPVIHLLSERGAEILESLTGTQPKRVSRSDPKPETIHHRLQIIRTKLIMDDACLKQGLTAPLWILEQDRNPAASDRLPPSQRRLLYHAFPAPPQPSTCQPDAACRLKVPHDISKPAAGVIDLIGFFEIDCSTEGRKQVAGKLPGYARLLAEKAHGRYFADCEKAVVRVFWVCRSWERVKNLCERIERDPVASYFRFTSASDLSATTALTSPIWHGVDGKRREILRLSHTPLSTPLSQGQP